MTILQKPARLQVQMIFESWQYVSSCKKHVNLHNQSQVSGQNPFYFSQLVASLDPITFL